MEAAVVSVDLGFLCGIRILAPSNFDAKAATLSPPRRRLLLSLSAAWSNTLDAGLFRGMLSLQKAADSWKEGRNCASPGAHLETGDTGSIEIGSSD